MNQLYAETCVKRRDNATTILLRVLIVFGIILGFCSFLLGQIVGTIGVVLIVVLVYLFPKLSVEYEYIFVDGQIDFDRITGKARRKTMLRIDFEQVEIMAPLNSHSLDEYTYIQCEHKNFSSGDKDSKPYVIIANVKEKKMKVTFEPDEKMVGMMKQKSPRKVVTY